MDEERSMSARDAALWALGEAVKFEADGRDFYLRAGSEAVNQLARAVFLALAEDEKEHVQRVREIYEELKGKAGWPEVETMVARSCGVLNAFEESAASGIVPADLSEQEALGRAAEMEKRGLLFYRARLAKATCEAETAFFRRLIDEEQGHLAAIERLIAAVT
jgi:rubrerythrin